MDQLKTHIARLRKVAQEVKAYILLQSSMIASRPSMIGDLRPETVKCLHPMPRARHTDLIARHSEDVRTLAISPRGKAAGDEIMHKDAAGDDRGPERHLVAESF